MPNRIIKESICTSDSINELSWFEEVLFYRLIVNCDDYGCFDGRAAIIKNRLFPLKENITAKSVNEAINKLATVGLVTLYEVNKKPYLQLPTWNDHQRLRNSKKKYPTPDEADCGSSPQVAASCGELPPRARVYENPNPNPNPNTNPNQNPKEEGADAPDTADEPPASSRPAIDYESIKALYNAVCKSFPRCTAMSEARKKSIKARFASGYSMEDFKTVFEKAEASGFLKGRNDRNWTASFDWLLKDANMAKVLDGNYDDHKGSETDGKNTGDHGPSKLYGTYL